LLSVQAFPDQKPDEQIAFSADPDAADSGNGGDPNSESSGGDLPTYRIFCSVIK
jgi:hypothetical protein